MSEENNSNEELLEEVSDEQIDEDLKSENPIKRVKAKARKHKKKAISLANLVKAWGLKLQTALLVVLFVILYFTWGLIESVLKWISGVDEVTVLNKTIDNGCYEIFVKEDTKSYCVDLESYNLAVEGQQYRLVEYQYYHVLEVIEDGFKIN